MALYNNDGTIYSAETIAEIIVQRFEDQPEFPGLSDILGSDWVCNFAIGPSPDQYRKNAYALARRIYDDYGGWLGDQS